MKKICIFPVITLALGLAQTGHASEKKAVFVMTNDAKENHVLSYTVQADGSLKAFGSFATGGRGSGGTTDPLGSQGSLTLSSDHSLLFAVNGERWFRRFLSTAQSWFWLTKSPPEAARQSPWLNTMVWFTLSILPATAAWSASKWTMAI